MTTTNNKRQKKTKERKRKKHSHRRQINNNKITKKTKMLLNLTYLHKHKTRSLCIKILYVVLGAAAKGLFNLVFGLFYN